MVVHSPGAGHMPHLWCGMSAHDDAPDVYITDIAAAVIAGEATRSQDGLETGGILLGTDTTGTVVIYDAGGPGPNAKRAPNAFHRDLNHAQTLAETAWKAHRWQWLGEWHTHLSGQLAPSDLDLTSYMRHLHDAELKFGRFVAVIVGLSPGNDVLAATWLVDRQRVRLVPLLTAPDRASAVHKR